MHLWAHMQTGVEGIKYRHGNKITQTLWLAYSSTQTFNTKRKTAVDICRNMGYHKDECIQTHIYTDTHTNHEKLVVTAPEYSKLHSPAHLPPLCLHSPGTNTKPSQGHLQCCFGQQFLPNCQIASSLSDGLSDIHTYTELMTAFQPPNCTAVLGG